MIGALAGRYVRTHSDTYREPIGAVQGALLGLVGLILAFGLSLAVGRYQDRRADVVNDANTIGTTYLRAQTIAEPQRSDSLALLRDYTDLAIHVTREVPASSSLAATTAEQGPRPARALAAGRRGDERGTRRERAAPVRRQPERDDRPADVRLSGLNNRVPNAVLWVELLAAALALGILALYLSMLGKGYVTVGAAAILVSILVLVTFDLDRPTRGMITIPSTPLVAARASMELPPAAPAPP